MLPLDLHAQFLHDQAHLGADVLLGIGGSHREIAFLVPDLVAQVRHLVAAGVPHGFLGVDAVKGAVALAVDTARCRNENSASGPKTRGVGQAGAGQVFFRLLGDAARIAGVGFLGAGLGDGAGQAKASARRRRDR